MNGSYVVRDLLSRESCSATSVFLSYQKRGFNVWFGRVLIINISTTRGGDGSFQRWETHRREVWNSIDLKVIWFEIHTMISDSNDFISAYFRYFQIQLISNVRLNCFEIPLISDSSWKFPVLSRFPSNMELGSLRTKLFCETSFKNRTSKLKNQTFLVGLPSKIEHGSSKTKLFCEASFKSDKWTTKYALDRFSNFYVDASKLRGKHLQLPCDMILPNCHTFKATKCATHRWSVRGLAKSIVAEPFQISSNPPRLPKLLQPSRPPAPATHFDPCARYANRSLNLNAPRLPCFNFWTALSLQRGAKFGDTLDTRSFATLALRG